MNPSPDPAVVDALRAAGCVFAEQEAALLTEAASGDAGALTGLVSRRVAGEPLEVIVGFAEFRGLRVRTAPGVFVPRRRTELVVEVARDLVDPGDVLVDLCCGTGAIAAALSAEVPGLEVYATDADPAAVACARSNLPGADVGVGDLTAPLPARLRGRVDLLTAHPPLVPTSALELLPPEARDHEPRTALEGGADGLDVLRRLLTQAPEWLASTGVMVTPVAAGQVPAALAAGWAQGLAGDVRSDPERDATVIVWWHAESETPSTGRTG